MEVHGRKRRRLHSVRCGLCLGEKTYTACLPVSSNRLFHLRIYPTRLSYWTTPVYLLSYWTTPMYLLSYWTTPVCLLSYWTTPMYLLSYWTTPVYLLFLLNFSSVLTVLTELLQCTYCSYWTSPVYLLSYWTSPVYLLKYASVAYCLTELLQYHHYILY